MLDGLNTLAREKALLLFFCILLGGCRSGQNSLRPSIEFTKIPPAREGGPALLERIEGSVAGAHSGQQLVLYARSGQWWIQPLTNEPFTKIQPDSKWRNYTQLGTEYAALLVEPGYHPASIMDSLPTEGGAVVAIAVVKGEPTPPEIIKTVHFSGYEWKVRTADSNRGGGITSYDPANAWTDGRGALHLRIANNSGKWTCAEVNLTRSLGYGLYRFVVQKSSQLEPAAVLSMFTWNDSGQEQNHKEFAVEITRWGDPLSKNAQYAVQPYYVPENVARFMVPSGILTYTFQWEPGRVSFLKAKNFHWHMSGVHFRDYHLLLDEHAEQIFTMTDDIAERARKIGGSTLRSISDISKHQRLKDDNRESVRPEEMLAELRSDNREPTRFLRLTHQVCEEHNDVATASLIENWIDQTGWRTWFLPETVRDL